MVKTLVFLVGAAMLVSCSDLDNDRVEELLTAESVYPRTVDIRVYCNDQTTAREVVDNNLSRHGYVTAQFVHTPEDIGKPLITFTEQAKPFLLETNDTLRAIDVQRVKVADETFRHVRNIEINPKGDKAVVDYTTELVNRTPFIVLYRQNVAGDQLRRTFFTKKNDRWTWDGKIVKMQKPEM
ncbi:hypothetical protein WBG78_22850 [Chryseolinea sp. T2]|uniref:hypothetical protein n=1 Tax=Chryseolinea sp. T2 TaxID=3129255 RepID=UPI003077D74A